MIKQILEKLLLKKNPYYDSNGFLDVKNKEVFNKIKSDMKKMEENILKQNGVMESNGQTYVFDQKVLNQMKNRKNKT